MYDEDYNLVLDQVMDPDAPISFINSVVIADDYVYATDSFRSQFYAVSETDRVVLPEDFGPNRGCNLTWVQIFRPYKSTFCVCCEMRLKRVMVGTWCSFPVNLFAWDLSYRCSQSGFTVCVRQAQVQREIGQERPTARSEEHPQPKMG